MPDRQYFKTKDSQIAAVVLAKKKGNERDENQYIGRLL